MKKNILKLSTVVMALSLAYTTQSCRSNSEDTPTVSTLNPENFKGTIKSGETWTLDATKTYKLTAGVTVEDGGQLVIPAGTRIECTGGTSAFVLVKQGGKIFSNGTATAPVVFTSPTNTLADWGGIVICGRAPINAGAASGATTATSEVGEVPYGGTIPNDNSGSITYTRVEYAGAVYSTTKEFNGISLFGVGNGTTIKYVQIYKSNDDGIEFFGGTVNTSYILANGSDDDNFDWTEGWNGTNEFWYGVRDAGRGNRGIEADNYEFGFKNNPYSNPTIKNITLIGNDFGTESQAIKLRRGTKGNLDNVVLSGFLKGIDVENDETLANVIDGSLKLTNVNFTNIPTKYSYKVTAGSSMALPTNLVYTENPNATGAGNGTSLPSWAQGWTRAF